MDWSVLSKLIVEVLARFVGQLAAELVRRLLPAEGTAPTPESPHRLREAVWQELNRRAATSARPGVRRGVNAVMARLNGVVLDSLWDRLLAAGAVGQRAVAFAASGREVQDFVNPAEEAAGLALELLDSTPRPATRAAEIAAFGSSDLPEDDRAGAVIPVNDTPNVPTGHDAGGGLPDETY